MKNYVQPGDVISAAAPYQVNSGGGALLGGSLFGIAVDTVASGATGVFATEGVFDVTKATTAGEAYTLGQRLFWDNTNKRITSTSTGNVAVGLAIVASAATGDPTVRMTLLPSTPAGT
jgi:predicted RecA/RadA family phage recombinase